MKNLGHVDGLSVQSKRQTKLSKSCSNPASIMDMIYAREPFSFRDILKYNDSTRCSIYLEHYLDCDYNGKYYKSFVGYLQLGFVDRISRWGPIRRLSQNVDNYSNYWGDFDE